MTLPSSLTSSSPCNVLDSFLIKTRCCLTINRSEGRTFQQRLTRTCRNCPRLVEVRAALEKENQVMLSPCTPCQLLLHGWRDCIWRATGNLPGSPKCPCFSRFCWTMRIWSERSSSGHGEMEMAAASSQGSPKQAHSSRRTAQIFHGVGMKQLSPGSTASPSPPGPEGGLGITSA